MTAPLKSTSFLSWMIQLDLSQWGIIDGRRCLLNSSDASVETARTSVRNFHHGLGVRFQARWSSARFPDLMLIGVKGKMCFHTCPNSSSNQPDVFIELALICAISSSRITTILFDTTWPNQIEVVGSLPKENLPFSSSSVPITSLFPPKLEVKRF